MGIKLAWYFFLFFLIFWLWNFKDTGPSMSIFNTLHSLFPVVSGVYFYLYFLGLGGGLSWGNCPLNFKWHYRKPQKGDGLCRGPCWMLFCHLPLSSSVFWSCTVSRSGSAHHCGQWWGKLICFVCFLFLFSFHWRHHVLVLCLYECFNHFHGGRILYLCSCTILFFSARKSVMYEINQSHLFENKIFILNFIKSNAVPHRLVLNVVSSANPCSNICNNCQEYSALLILCRSG